MKKILALAIAVLLLFVGSASARPFYRRSVRPAYVTVSTLPNPLQIDIETHFKMGQTQWDGGGFNWPCTVQFPESPKVIVLSWDEPIEAKSVTVTGATLRSYTPTGAVLVPVGSINAADVKFRIYHF